MSEHIWADLVPHDIDQWGKPPDVTLAAGVLMVTVRRGPTTILATRHEGWWTVRKLKGGRELGCKTSKHIPVRLRKTIERVRRL